MKDLNEDLYYSREVIFEGQTFTAISYAYWNNCGEGEMLGGDASETLKKKYPNNE